MATSRSLIGAVEVDTEATFGDTATAPTPTAAEYLEVFDLALGLVSEPLEHKVIREVFTDVPPLVGSQRGSTVGFKYRLSRPGAVIAAATDIQAVLLGYACNGLHTDTKGEGAVTGGADTTHFVVADADAPSAGAFVAVKDLTGGTAIEGRWVTEVVSAAGSSTCTVNQAFSFTPANGDKLYAGHTIYPTDAVGSGESLAMRITLEDTNQRFNLFGVRASSVKLSVADGLVTVAMEFMVAAWTRVDGVSLPGGSWQHGLPIAYHPHSAFYVGGSAVGIAGDWEFDMGIDLKALETPDAQGLSEYEFANMTPTLTYKPRFANTHFDRFGNRTVHELMMVKEGPSVAAVGSGLFGIHMGSAHLTQTPQHEDRDGIRYITCNARAGTYSGDVGTPAAPGDTRFRIGLLTAQ